MDLARILRPEATDRRAHLIDLALLIGTALLVMASGYGWRDPWPADEPRFALIARDMVLTGNWLIPMVGGDLYQDKPPLFFWLLALGYLITGSMRTAFLAPSLIAMTASVLLVYDLGRRLGNRASGLAGALLLTLTLQFFWEGRQAQIDPTLTFWVTLGFYGLVRHLLLGPAWRWYVVGFAAAGFGVITKGVGFLALLVFIPWFALRGPGWQPRPRLQGGWRWALGPLAFLLAISVWLVPMLLAARSDPALAAYRDEILFSQTVERYGSAWHHRKPFWYLLVAVIPVLWLPITVLLPWLIPAWKRAIAHRELRVALPLAWVGLVVLFFTLSTGKRGVYILPALPAMALAAGPALVELRNRKGPARAIFVTAAIIASILLAAGIYFLLAHERRSALVSTYGIEPVGYLLAGGLLGVVLLALLRLRRAYSAYAALVALLMLLTGYWINPVLNDVRSGRAFGQAIAQATRDVQELGLVGYREQYLLAIDRPTFNFGHRRTREGDQEAMDAARWLSESSKRALIVGASALNRCFDPQAATLLTVANRESWYLVTRGARADCVARGEPDAVRYYDPHRPPRLDAATRS